VGTGKYAGEGREEGEFGELSEVDISCDLYLLAHSVEEGYRVSEEVVGQVCCVLLSPLSLMTVSSVAG